MRSDARICREYGNSHDPRAADSDRRVPGFRVVLGEKCLFSSLSWGEGRG
jgi:hypothetical protein